MRSTDNDLDCFEIVRTALLGRPQNKYLSPCMRHTDVAAGVTFLRKFTSEEFIKFSAEYAICNELALFADLGGHIEELGVTKQVLAASNKSNFIQAHATQSNVRSRCKRATSLQLQHLFRTDINLDNSDTNL